jgi:hypothetical protein
MMRQYSERSFCRDRFQWTKCVVKYLCDALSPNSSQLVVLLAEVVQHHNDPQLRKAGDIIGWIIIDSLLDYMTVFDVA